MFMIGIDPHKGSHTATAVDPNDARSAAIVALRNASLNTVTGEHEDRVILRLLADRYHQLTAQRTRAVCRLHAVLCLLIEGGTSRSLTAARATKLLADVQICDAIAFQRVAACGDFVTEIATYDQALADTRTRTVAAVLAAKTTVDEVYGIGPIGAAIILGRSGDIRRFPTTGLAPQNSRLFGEVTPELSSTLNLEHTPRPRGRTRAARTSRPGRLLTQRGFAVPPSVTDRQKRVSFGRLRPHSIRAVFCESDVSLKRRGARFRKTLPRTEPSGSSPADLGQRFPSHSLRVARHSPHGEGRNCQRARDHAAVPGRGRNGRRAARNLAPREGLHQPQPLAG